MVGQNLSEGDGLFADGDNHEAQGWRQWTADWTASALTNTLLAQGEGLHVQCRSN